MFFLALVSCVFWRILALEVVHCVTGIFWCRRTRGECREPCGSAITAPPMHCNGPFGTGPTITIPGAVRNPNGSRPCSAGFPSVFWTRIFSGSVGSARWLLCCARCIFWELSFPKITFVKVVLCDMFEMLSLWRHNGFLIPGF